MKILVTGASGFVGKNLCSTLECIRDGKDTVHTLPNKDSVVIYKCDRDTTEEELDFFCKDADFVFNFAGVNRPQKETEYMIGNYEFLNDLFKRLKKYNNTCPVVIASSIQATLEGRYQDSEYGKSKLAGEVIARKYAEETGAKVLIYRFPNLFGKWCKPNYNSVVATFCYNIAHDLPISINNPNTVLNLVYIDDLIEEMMNALNFKEHRGDFVGTRIVKKKRGDFCFVPISYDVSLGEIVDWLEFFVKQENVFWAYEMPNESFAKKLYSTYLSYLPSKKARIDLKMNVDERGSFTELIRTKACGQVSVNVSKPGVTKGQHWHHSKWELFIVVSGHALIQERRIGSHEVYEYEVSGDKIQAVYMLPGYTHNIVNLSNTQDLVTVMWANEAFDSSKPDTFFEIVGEE